MEKRWQIAIRRAPAILSIRPDLRWISTHCVRALPILRYDSGEGKIAQTKMLWEILEREYAKGNYVIAGGDFNQMFPGTEEKYPIFATEFWVPGILEESDLPDGWQYVFDESTPTCRLLDKPYDEKSSQRYVIDGFIISPNVELLYAETIDCGFEYSDHNPVLMEIILK